VAVITEEHLLGFCFSGCHPRRGSASAFAFVFQDEHRPSAKSRVESATARPDAERTLQAASSQGTRRGLEPATRATAHSTNEQPFS
jgi:hypothetical protein